MMIALCISIIFPSTSPAASLIAVSRSWLAPYINQSINHSAKLNQIHQKYKAIKSKLSIDMLNQSIFITNHRNKKKINK